MPYLKFENKEDELKAKELIDDIADGNNHQVKGLVAYLVDPKHGPVCFFSEKPYLEELNKMNLEYRIIPKEEITVPFAVALRELHQQYSNEL